MNLTFDPAGTIEVFGIPGYWNLLWIIPLLAGLATAIACVWPWRTKGPEGPPYVGFDEMLDDHLRPIGRDPKQYAESYHQTGEKWTYENIAAGRILHPGTPCGPQCWRKPGGHRWGDDG